MSAGQTLSAIAIVLTLLAPAAIADERGSASVIDYGTTDGPGVEATAVTYVSAEESTGKPVQRSATPASVALTASPAPVAISAHNCIPRTDPRGVSLSFEIFESSIGDCISFVSPEPLRPTPRGNTRRPPRPSPEALAQSAYDRVISLAPEPELTIAPSRIGLTGLPSYFWVGNDLRPISATAGVRGLTVTAEARPVRYLWDFGDGATRQTQHGGRPWTPARRGNVGHLYETKGRYEPTVTVVWAARWRVNGGPWDDLGYFSTTGSAEYPVREMIAVLVRRR